MKAYIYTRVSSEKQANPNHVSLDVQKAECVKMAKELGYTKFEYIREIGSALNPNKLQGQTRMWNKIKPNQAVFIYDYDRLSRNIEFATALMVKIKKKNIKLHCVRFPLDYSTPEGYHALIGKFNDAELSSRLLGEKIKASLNHIREQGGCVGAAPYGYEIIPESGRKLQSNFVEQRVMKLIHAMNKGDYTVDQINNLLLTKCVPQDDDSLQVPLIIKNLDGTDVNSVCLTYKDIADQLNDYKVFRRGKAWGETSIRNICKRNLDSDDELTIDMEIMTLSGEKRKSEENDDEPPRHKRRRRPNNVN